VDRVFLDANVLFSAAYQPANPILALWKLAQTSLLSSGLAVFEAEMALSHKRPARLADLAPLVAALTVVPEPTPGQTLPTAIVLPAKDEPLFLAALGAQATHFLTGDLKHFGTYLGQTIAGILILRPSVYLQGRQGP
jgi:hypothetical protein